MKNLVIVGGGPRGLAVALRATQYKDKFNIFVVDSSPLSTWKFPNMLSNMEMRSPITFDLVTFQRDLQKYSLANYLKEEVIAESQYDVEINKSFCQRKEFISYLTYIIYELKNLGVNFISTNVTKINNSFIATNKGAINYDYLILATGKQTQKYKYPQYLKGKSFLKTKCLSKNSWTNKVVSVVGSGQQSAEMVEYLTSQKAKVYWIQKYIPKVRQYPIPSFKDWGIASALGPFYRKTLTDRYKYLERVKDWGPTITPYINNLLKERKYTVIHKPRNTKEIDINSQFFLACGHTNEIDILDTSLDFNKNINNTCLPDIVDSFQSSSHPNIYFTGTLATHFDGPRQSSIISAGTTAHTILSSILNKAA